MRFLEAGRRGGQHGPTSDMTAKSSQYRLIQLNNQRRQRQPVVLILLALVVEVRCARNAKIENA